MRDDPTVVDLVLRAREGDRAAWDEIVARYAPLVWSICHHFRLRRPDTDDVGQVVWLRLVEHLPALHEPAALPGWLVTTTRRECLRVLRTRQRRDLHERPLPPGGQADLAELDENWADSPEAELLRIELQAALQAALAALPASCQQLLALLTEEPPLSYAQISAKLAMPVGSIGPNRGRCLQVLRRHPVLAALIEEAQHVAG
jgi:RNA polymerase sigma factor (sigma-70 family)